MFLEKLLPKLKEPTTIKNGGIEIPHFFVSDLFMNTPEESFQLQENLLTSLTTIKRFSKITK